MVKGKSGWIRILEATIAVMLVTGVLVVLYTKQSSGTIDQSQELHNIQKKVLKDIATKENLRNFVLDEDETQLNISISTYIPSHIGYSLRVCELSKPCKMSTETFTETLEKDVIADSTIISSNVTQYTPKKVALFLWRI